MIRAVIFDCFGVLVHGSLEYLYEITPPERHDELHDVSRSADYGVVSVEEYSRLVSDITGKSLDEIRAILREQRIINPSMVALVQSVRHHGHKTGLLSNIGREGMRGLFTDKELDTLFDSVVLSSEVHMVKPHADIFEYALARLELDPEEVLFIDDTQANVAGARAVGIDAIQFTSQYHLESELQARGIAYA